MFIDSNQAISSFKVGRECAEGFWRNLMLLFSSVPQSANKHLQDKGIVEVAVAVCLFVLI